MVTIISQGHGGTRVTRCKHPYLLCDCGLEFPIYRHPVEAGEWESPGWIAHVRQVQRDEAAANLPMTQPTEHGFTIENVDGVIVIGRTEGPA